MKDGFGNRPLPDVMELGGVHQDLDLLCLEAEPVADRAGHHRHLSELLSQCGLALAQGVKQDVGALANGGVAPTVLVTYMRRSASRSAPDGSCASAGRAAVPYEVVTAKPSPWWESASAMRAIADATSSASPSTSAQVEEGAFRPEAEHCVGLVQNDGGAEQAHPGAHDRLTRRLDRRDKRGHTFGIGIGAVSAGPNAMSVNAVSEGLGLSRLGGYQAATGWGASAPSR